MDIFWKVLAGILIAWLSSWITVRASLEKFRTERWWEKQADAYSHLLGVLHDAKEYSSKNLDAEWYDRALSKVDNQELLDRSNAVESEIERIMDVDSFYLSRSTIQRLKKYKASLRKAGTDNSGENNSWEVFLQDTYTATNSCLNDVMDIAKLELNVPEHNKGLLSLALGLLPLRSSSRKA